MNFLISIHVYELVLVIWAIPLQVKKLVKCFLLHITYGDTQPSNVKWLVGWSWIANSNTHISCCFLFQLFMNKFLVECPINASGCQGYWSCSYTCLWSCNILFNVQPVTSKKIHLWQHTEFDSSMHVNLWQHKLQLTWIHNHWIFRWESTTYWFVAQHLVWFVVQEKLKMHYWNI